MGATRWMPALFTSTSVSSTRSSSSVCSQQVHLPGVPTDLGRHLGRPVAVEIGHRHSRAHPGQHPATGKTDTACSAGDQGLRPASGHRIRIRQRARSMASAHSVQSTGFAAAPPSEAIRRYEKGSTSTGSARSTVTGPSPSADQISSRTVPATSSPSEPNSGLQPGRVGVHLRTAPDRSRNSGTSPPGPSRRPRSGRRTPAPAPPTRRRLPASTANSNDESHRSASATGCRHEDQRTVRFTVPGLAVRRVERHLRARRRRLCGQPTVDLRVQHRAGRNGRPHRGRRRWRR